MTTTAPTALPDDITGWLTPEEGACLARYAEGRRVLEIGSYCGRSTVCMARVARHVTVIDPLDGRATDSPRDTEEELRRNLARYGVADKVTVLRGTTLDVAPGLEPGGFDFAFVDGDHSGRAVILDYLHAARVLTPGALIAFHDYGSPIDEPVTRAVGRILATSATMVEVCGTVAVVRPLAVGMPVCVPYFGVPTASGAIDFRTHAALCQARDRCSLFREELSQMSALGWNFNHLYAKALNARKQGVTHFVMLHDDVVPQAAQGYGTWLEMLLAYMRAAKLAVISAACPIKDDSGETSTAVEPMTVIDGQRTFGKARRLTRGEIGPLLTSGNTPGLRINTGCMVIDIRQAWADQLVFHQEDGIRRGADGDYEPWFYPEDWGMSRWLEERGIPYGVTADVRCLHVGRKAWGDDVPRPDAGANATTV